MRRWPSEKRQTSASSTTSRFPLTTRSMLEARAPKRAAKVPRPVDWSARVIPRVSRARLEGWVRVGAEVARRGLWRVVVDVADAAAHRAAVPVHHVRVHLGDR